MLARKGILNTIVEAYAPRKRGTMVHRTLLVALAILFVGAMGSDCRAAVTTAASPGGSFDAAITRIGPGGGSVTVTLPGERTFPVPDADARAKLKFAAPGDIAKIDVDNAASPTAIVKLYEVDRPVPLGSRVLAVGLAVLVLLAVVGAATGWNPRKLLIGKDGRYSNSQLQLALWFGAIATAYMAAFGLRLAWLGWDFIGGVGLTTNVVALTGLSAFSFGGAKIITAQKIDNAVQAAPKPGRPAPHIVVAPGGVTKTPPANGPRLVADLFQNDTGDADLGDLQMILIALTAAVIFVATAFHFLGSLQLSPSVMLPDVDTTLLASFGIGQGAYLAKKAALPLGQG